MKFVSDLDYYWACVCNYIYECIGYKYPYPVEGSMVERFPKIQRWLAKQIPYDAW